MADTAEGLPTFERPPVTEVAISTSFRSLPSPAFLRVGYFWEALRDRFPGYEEHPPYEAPIERFDVPTGMPRLPFEFATGAPPPPRLWFLSPEGNELLQVQRDWFACNWRKLTPSHEYSRWQSRWQAFEQGWELFAEQVARHFEPEVEHLQCEVTYINHIEPEGVWQHHGQLDRVITLARTPHEPEAPSGQFLPEAEAVNLNARYVMQDDNGVPIGRLHVAVTEAYKRNDESPVIQLALTARGRPDGKGFDGVRRFSERAHVWIVKSFCALTTPLMHEAWRRVPKVSPNGDED